jgi:methyl-accepting chemotaxis protein
MNLPSFSVKIKLLATLGLLVIALSAISAVGLTALKQANENLDVLFAQRTRPVAWLGQIYGLQLQNIEELDLAMAQQDPAVSARMEREIERNRELIAQYLREWDAIISSAEGRTLYTGIIETRLKVVAGTDAVRDALRAGDIAGAKKLRMELVQPAFEPLRQKIAEALEFQLGRAKQQRDVSHEAYESKRNLVLTVSVAGIALAAMFSLMLVGSIMRSLKAAVAICKSIAAGNLNNEVRIETDDEFGELLGSLKDMDAKLNQIVGSVRDAADSVGGAAQQLTQGNDDLSERTQDQAASLQQTATSMEEMTATVKRNADNARQANDLAGGARIEAEKGGEVVTRAVAAMEDINVSSRKIADIIGVIDEIAFQTNLLALNAAVEAARAGEQGRGFAVVATEVRSLAQRSAVAAKEIKELIQDSVHKVKAGSELVEASGTTLSGIMESVKRVSTIIAEIASASDAQSAGIEQVNSAVNQMDTSTQQNAALVEEAAAASKAMQMRAEQLVHQIAYFKTRGTAAAVVHAPQAMPIRSAPTRPTLVKPVRKPVTRSVKRAGTLSAAPIKKVSGDANTWSEF